ncbi:haloacid dehalogenase-like hydrolase domain-containing protein 3 isoform X2 [Pristis pectinata]|uniref:haloacid dehalogenase-like hydrolase domain-containing protein 3 isoform X2 n=1 Tax=Pristis pectinata TaxID=685728 RepID=UPI00223D54F8|nr:haloacid dehalogenase-like hydrolase domain-containing protein 3 isoform X2 [Pristis pectinata]
MQVVGRVVCGRPPFCRGRGVEEMILLLCAENLAPPPSPPSPLSPPLVPLLLSSSPENEAMNQHRFDRSDSPGREGPFNEC